MASRTIKMKAGDSLLATAVHKDANGDPINLATAGITITSGVLSPDGLTRHELAVTISDQAANPGEFTITGNTTGWAPRKGWRWDTRYTDSTGYSWSDDTQHIDVSERIA